MVGDVDASFGAYRMDNAMQDAIQSIRLPVVFSIQKVIAFTSRG